MKLNDAAYIGYAVGIYIFMYVFICVAAGRGAFVARSSSHRQRQRMCKYMMNENSNIDMLQWYLYVINART